MKDKKSLFQQKFQQICWENVGKREKRAKKAPPSITER